MDESVPDEKPAKLGILHNRRVAISDLGAILIAQGRVGALGLRPLAHL